MAIDTNKLGCTNKSVTGSSLDGFAILLMGCCKTKVYEVDNITFISKAKEEIARFDVTMDIALAVDILQTIYLRTNKVKPLLVIGCKIISFLYLGS